MPKALWIVFYHSISDPKKLEAYAKLAPAATAPFGSRYLARGTAAAVFEDGLKQRVVVNEFPSVEQAVAAYNCLAYQEALEALDDGAVRHAPCSKALESGHP